MRTTKENVQKLDDMVSRLSNQLPPPRFKATQTTKVKRAKGYGVVVKQTETQTTIEPIDDPKE